MLNTRLKYKSTATIPKALEQKLKLKDGDVLKVIVENGSGDTIKVGQKRSRHRHARHLNSGYMRCT